MLFVFLLKTRLLCVVLSACALVLLHKLAVCLRPLVVPSQVGRCAVSALAHRTESFIQPREQLTDTELSLPHSKRLCAAFPVLSSLSLHVQLTAAAFIVHFFTHVAAVSIDPADAGVRAKQNYSTPTPLFDRSKQVHVIQDLHCYLCDIKVYVTEAPALISVTDQEQHVPIDNNNVFLFFLFFNSAALK